MPRREDRAAQAPRHRQHAHSVVDPHRRLVADPRLAVGLLAVLHVEAADDVRVVVILRGRDRRRVLVDAELPEPLPVPIGLVAAQHVEPQLVQRRLAKLAIGDRGQPGEHPAPQPRGDRATPRELRIDFTHCNSSLVACRCRQPPGPSVAGQPTPSPRKESGSAGRIGAAQSDTTPVGGRWSASDDAAPIRPAALLLPTVAVHRAGAGCATLPHHARTAAYRHRPSSRSKLPARRSSFALSNAAFLIFRLGVRGNSSTNST